MMWSIAIAIALDIRNSDSYNSRMRTSEVLSFFGGQVKTAEALSIKQGSVGKWREFPPPLRQVQIERVTRGHLKAEPGIFEQLSLTHRREHEEHVRRMAE